jgi:hypothetical protein
VKDESGIKEAGPAGHLGIGNAALDKPAKSKTV